MSDAGTDAQTPLTKRLEPTRQYAACASQQMVIVPGGVPCETPVAASTDVGNTIGT
jgi:hypothetical protein